MYETNASSTSVKDLVIWKRQRFTVTLFSLTSGNITKAGIRFMNEINSHRVGLQYFETNFGMIEIDWQPADPVIRLQVRDELGQPVLQQRMRLSEISKP